MTGLDCLAQVLSLAVIRMTLDIRLDTRRANGADPMVALRGRTAWCAVPKACQTEISSAGAAVQHARMPIRIRHRNPSFRNAGPSIHFRRARSVFHISHVIAILGRTLVAFATAWARIRGRTLFARAWLATIGAARLPTMRTMTAIVKPTATTIVRSGKSSGAPWNAGTISCSIALSKEAALSKPTLQLRRAVSLYIVTESCLLVIAVIVGGMFDLADVAVGLALIVGSVMAAFFAVLFRSKAAIVCVGSGLAGTLAGIAVSAPLHYNPVAIAITTSLGWCVLSLITPSVRPNKPGHCKKCGYDLAGLDTCPECGPRDHFTAA